MEIKIYEALCIGAFYKTYFCVVFSHVVDTINFQANKWRRNFNMFYTFTENFSHKCHLTLIFIY